MAPIIRAGVKAEELARMPSHPRNGAQSRASLTIHPALWCC